MKKNTLEGIISGFLEKVMKDLNESRLKYLAQLAEDNQQKVNESIFEVDAHVEQDWPLKDSIEIDIYLKRQNQIKLHKQR